MAYYQTPIGQYLSLKFVMKIMESKVFCSKKSLTRITFLLYNKMFHKLTDIFIFSTQEMNE